MSETEVPVSLSVDGHLSFRDARQAPCASCTSSPCCTYLLLGDFQMGNLMQVEHAIYLLNFEGVVLGLAQDRLVEVYWHQPCRYLDVPTGMCQVHSTPAQPAVCVQYNAHSCAYRERMIPDLYPDRPLLDRHRMAWLAERTVFGDDRNVDSFPDWGQMLEAFSSMPLERPPAAAPAPDPITEEWRSIVLSDKPIEHAVGAPHHFADREVSDPCQGCGAWCCQMLVFNRGLPGNASQLEFMRYCLGFPSVEIGVAADSWAVIVHTTCRHFEGGRCAVYGTDERPLECGYYDALNCSYRSHFGVPVPEEIVRVSQQQFEVLADSIVFDDLGRITAIPPLEVLRNRLASVERAGV